MSRIKKTTPVAEPVAFPPEFFDRPGQPEYRVTFVMTAANSKSMAKKLAQLTGDSGVDAKFKKIARGMSRADRLSEAMDAVRDAISQVEELYEEIDSWYENLPESLQGGDKGSEISECRDQLDTVKQNLDDAESEATQVSFPGMY